VLATTDIAGTYTFSLNEKGEFVLGWPKEPVITYADSVYYVAGNFTKWAEGMLALPASVELPADSALEFKEVLLRTVLADGDSLRQDTVWYGQANEGAYMTRESSAWTLDGDKNVLAKTDIAGTYTFSIDEQGHFVLGWPEMPVRYYAKNNWDGGEWSWKEMDLFEENIYILDSVVFGGTGININTVANDKDALWYKVDSNLIVMNGASDLTTDGTSTFKSIIGIDPVVYYKDTVRMKGDVRTIDSNGEIKESVFLQAGDTIALFFNAADSTLVATILSSPVQPEPVKRFDLTIVQDSVWSKDGGKVAAWIWGKDGLTGQWTAWATNSNDTLTLKVDERADSIIFKRFAPEVEVPYWEGSAEYQWNEIAKSEIADCHLFIITDWNNGVWCEREQPVEDKFYVTGNDALVGAEKAWQADAIEMVDYTYTFPMLAAGEYQLKVTDGTWEHAWGYDNLSPTVAIEGLYTDVDGNICFTVYTPNDVTVTFAQGYVVVTGDFTNPTPATPDFGLLVNGTTYQAGTPEDKGDYVEYAVNIDLVEDEFVQLYDNVNKAGWTVNPEGEGFTNFDIHDNAYYIKQTGSYQFYIKIPKEGMNSGLYVGYQGTGTGLYELKHSAEVQKFMKNNRLYIKKGGRIFDLQGLFVR
ncbi:MAG: hypothetical protein MJZ65_03890, partial [Paludibacteraceae bacterium]|nr:hypothetical protein [Paludibacteraceae bacterium]